MKTCACCIVGLWLSVSPLLAAQAREIPLVSCGSVTARADGEIIQNRFIYVTGQDGVVVSGKRDVLIRRCKILYGTGHHGIRFSHADGLRIEDCEIQCHNAPKTGKIEGHNSNCISGYASNRVSMERVKMSDGSAGIYLLLCDNSSLRTLEGHNFRGDFPRGQFIQFDKCIGGLVEHFSVINDPDIAYTEDNINCYKSGGQLFRKGLIQGNNSPSGVGILWEDQNDPKARGGFGGLAEDVDLIDMGNGACTGADGSRDIVFRRIRVRDSHNQGQAGRAKPSSNCLVFSGYGAPGNFGKGLRVEDCLVYNLANPNNICWPRDSFDLLEITQQDFKPRSPIVLNWPWRVLPSGDLVVPEAVDAMPAPGKRVRQFNERYEGTDLYHLVYLPTDWQEGKTYPVIVEYPGNRYQTSFGTVEGCSLGYGISGGEGVIWVCLPFVDQKNKRNAVTWWGDVDATVAYCKHTVRRICQAYGGDPNRVVLAGFSRGAIACNYIGLRDDEIASLWRGFICHSHYDGIIETWPYADCDRASAITRLARLGDRPQFISEGGSTEAIKTYLRAVCPSGNFTFVEGSFRDHTDTWVLGDIPERRAVREWFRWVTGP